MRYRPRFSHLILVGFLLLVGSPLALSTSREDGYRAARLKCEEIHLGMTRDEIAAVLSGWRCIESTSWSNRDETIWEAADGGFIRAEFDSDGKVIQAEPVHRSSNEPGPLLRWLLGR